MPGSRSTGSPLRTASGTARRTRAISSSRSAATRRGGHRPARARDSGGRGEARRPRARRACRSARRAPARHRAAAASRLSPRPSTSAPTPERAAELVARSRSSRPGREAAKSTGSWPDRLHGVGVHGDAVVGAPTAASSATGCDGADLVVGPHHRDQRDVVRVAGEGGARRCPGAPGRPSRPAATRRRRPRGRRARRPGRAPRGARRRWRAPGRRRGSAARRDQYRPLTARLSASVPPAGEDHL